MGRASGRLARHGPFGHLYLHTIMTVLASVANTLFRILFLFSILSCLHLRATPFSAEGVGACASFLYLSDTSPNTDLRSGYCTSTRTFHIMRAPSFLPSSMKGKCALGPFLSILVIECQHKWSCVNLCQMMDKVQIRSKGMFLRLSILFWRLMYYV
jgi:hypothetical protein